MADQPEHPDVDDTEAIIWQGRYELAMREAEQQRRQTEQWQRAARMILAIRRWTVRVPDGECASAYEYPVYAPSAASSATRAKPRPARVVPTGVPSIPQQRRLSHPAVADLTDRVRQSNRGGRS